MTNLRCPKCRSFLDTDGKIYWCTFIGSQRNGTREKACGFVGHPRGHTLADLNESLTRARREWREGRNE